MKSSIHLKTRPLLALLFIGLIIYGLSYFSFLQMDNIVHGDLYEYGLQYNDDWALPYWGLSRLYVNYILLSILVISISIILIALYIKTHNANLRLFSSLFIVSAIIMTGFSILPISQIDTIVHGDLYNYFLEFSYEWAVPYWNYWYFTFFSLLLVTVTNFSSIILLFIGLRSSFERDLINITRFTLTLSGAIALLMSINFNSSILAFVGLGLILWGLLFIYMRKEKHVKESLLDATVASSLVTINQIIQKMNYKGKTMYLPPKYFNDNETKIYVPERNDGKLPSLEQLRNQEKSVFIEKPKGLLLTPVGAELTKLFEKQLGTNFVQENLNNLQKKLPKLLIEKLEIAQDFDMTTMQNKINIKINNPIYTTLYKDASVTNEKIASPLSSTLAIILAKTIGKPIIINKQKKEDNILEIEFQIFEEE